MSRIKRFFLSRVTILALILLALAAVTLGALVPQEFITGQAELEKWRSLHPPLARISDLLGLFHIYTTPGFAVILLLVCISLGISTVEQGKAAWRKTFSNSPAAEPVGTYPVPLETAAQILHDSGYIRTAPGTLRFVKSPWGYWGSFSLHLGMLVCIAASLLITVTQQRGSSDLLQGETRLPGAPWMSEERGLLAGTLVLPEPVRFDGMHLDYERGSVKSVVSDLRFGADSSARTAAQAAINAPLNHKGVTIYQGNEYGHSFIVEILSSAGELSQAAYSIRFPSRIQDAGYNDFRIPGEPRLLQAKYYPFASGRPLAADEMSVTLRLTDNGRESGRLTLRPGESGMLGGNRIRLLEVREWGRLIFVRIQGIEGVFAGFLLIVIGATLTYCTPPREAWLTHQGESILLSWRSARFAELYREELESVIHWLEQER